MGLEPLCLRLRLGACLQSGRWVPGSRPQPHRAPRRGPSTCRSLSHTPLRRRGARGQAGGRVRPQAARVWPAGRGCVSSEGGDLRRADISRPPHSMALKSDNSGRPPTRCRARDGCFNPYLTRTCAWGGRILSHSPDGETEAQPCTWLPRPHSRFGTEPGQAWDQAGLTPVWRAVTLVRAACSPGSVSAAEPTKLSFHRRMPCRVVLPASGPREPRAGSPASPRSP